MEPVDPTRSALAPAATSPGPGPRSAPPRSRRSRSAGDARPGRDAALPGARREAGAGRAAGRRQPRARELDPVRAAGECQPARRARAMEPLSPYSPGQNGLPPPEPADAHLLALGFAAWDAALAAASDGNADRARLWSIDPAGRRLLAAVFGNSPFLARVAAEEWAFLIRLVEAGPDTLFDKLRAATTRPGDGGENTAELMHRLRIAKRRVALLAGVAELAGWWSLERQMEALSAFADAAITA